MPSKVEIPILDCSEIEGDLEQIQDSEQFKKFAQKLGDGFRHVGFVYLINHETTPQILAKMDEKSKEFFSLPNDIKLKYSKVDAVENFQGYTAPGDERLAEVAKAATGVAPPELKEAYDFWGYEMNDESTYPAEVPGFKQAVDELRSSMTNLTKKLLRCFAEYLELEDKNYFINKHLALEDFSIRTHNDVRYNHYFSIDTPNEQGQGQDEVNGDPEEIIRLGEHCDWGTFTYLFQDEVGGLEAKMADGQWVPVKPIPDSIVFNAGLMLEMWSGGHLPATFHRVKAIGKQQKQKSRRSIGFFIQPDGTTHCEPVVPLKPNWVPDIPFQPTEIHFDYFRNRVKQSRHY